MFSGTSLEYPPAFVLFFSFLQFTKTFLTGILLCIDNPFFFLQLINFIGVYLNNIGFTDNTQAVGSLLLRIFITPDSFKDMVRKYMEVFFVWFAHGPLLSFISGLSFPYCTYIVPTIKAECQLNNMLCVQASLRLLLQLFMFAIVPGDEVFSVVRQGFRYSRNSLVKMRI